MNTLVWKVYGLLTRASSTPTLLAAFFTESDALLFVQSEHDAGRHAYYRHEVEA